MGTEEIKRDFCFSFSFRGFPPPFLQSSVFALGSLSKKLPNHTVTFLGVALLWSVGFFRSPVRAVTCLSTAVGVLCVGGYRFLLASIGNQGNKNTVYAAGMFSRMTHVLKDCSLCYSSNNTNMP